MASFLHQSSFLVWFGMCSDLVAHPCSTYLSPKYGKRTSLAARKTGETKAQLTDASRREMRNAYVYSIKE